MTSDGEVVTNETCNSRCGCNCSYCSNWAIDCQQNNRQREAGNSY